MSDASVRSATAAMAEECAAADGAAVTHSPDDPRHVTYLETVARLHGYTPERYPALFRSFRTPGTRSPRQNTGGQEEDAFRDAQRVEYLAPLRSNGAASARAVVTRKEPVHAFFAALNIHNIAPDGTPRLLASGATNGYLRQTLTVGTDDTRAERLPETGQNVATLTWSVEYADGTREGRSCSTAGAWNAARDPTVLAPVVKPDRKVGDLRNVVIGLARGFNDPEVNADLDYWFWQDDVQNTRLLVPFAGSMYFTQEIAELGPNNPQYTADLTRRQGGMATVAGQASGRNFRIDPDDPKRLHFSFVPTSTTAGTALDFGESWWTSDTQTFLGVTVFVTFTDRTSGWSSVVSAEQPDLDPTDGVAFVRPLVFVWHCLAGGTRITMADGSEQSVEDLDSGARVLGPGRTPRTVQATYAQPHHGEVWVVRTRGGRSLTCSGSHPVMTPQGAVSASDLTAGATVLTADGQDVVSGTDRRTYDGETLFNLELDGAEDGSTLYAGGLLVGDHRTQVRLVRTPDPAQVRRTLPEHLRTDYDSHLRDVAAGRRR